MKFSKIFSIALLPVLFLGCFRTIYGAEEFAPVSKNLTLIEATKRGDLRKTMTLLKAENVDPNQTDSEGRTPLMFAVQQKGWIAPGMISMLLARGADLNAKDNEGLSSLAHAISANKPQAARQLLSRGADPDLPKSLTVPEKIKKILARDSTKRKQPKVLIDPITGEDITSLDPSELITVGKNTYKKEIMFKYILTQIASKTLEKIKDPVSRVPIGREKIAELAAHYGIPMNELENGTPLESLQTGEQYTAEQYTLDSDTSEDEDETPAPRPVSVFVESRKSVFEGVRPTEEQEKQPIRSFLERLSQQDSLRDFRDMIQKNTLRALVYRLQQKNDELLDKSLSESHYEHIKLEIRILKNTIQNRITTFKGQKARREAPKKEPFFRMDFTEE